MINYRSSECGFWLDCLKGLEGLRDGTLKEANHGDELAAVDVIADEHHALVSQHLEHECCIETLHQKEEELDA